LFVVEVFLIHRLWRCFEFLRSILLQMEIVEFVLCVVRSVYLCPLGHAQLIEELLAPFRFDSILWLICLVTYWRCLWRAHVPICVYLLTLRLLHSLNLRSEYCFRMPHINT